MSHSLAIRKNFTAHQNKDTQSVAKTWATDHLYCDYKEQPPSSAWCFTFLSRELSTSWYEIMHLRILGNLPILGDFSLLLNQLTEHSMPLCLNVHQDCCENFKSHKTCEVCMFRCKLIVTLCELISTMGGFTVESTPSKRTDVIYSCQVCRWNSSGHFQSMSLSLICIVPYQFWLFRCVLQFVAAWCIVNAVFSILWVYSSHIALMCFLFSVFITSSRLCYALKCSLWQLSCINLKTTGIKSLTVTKGKHFGWFHTIDWHISKGASRHTHTHT